MPKKPKPQADKARAARSRAAKRKRGLVPIEVWTHPDDRAKVQEYARGQIALRGL